MVVVIMGIIGAIAVPRLSRAGTGTRMAALVEDLTIMNNAVELYKVEHNGVIPTRVAQLTEYSDEAGNTQTTFGYPYVFGPYLHKIPPLPLGSNRGSTGITNNGQPGDNDGIGWWVNPVTGVVHANLPDSEQSQDGVQFNQAAFGGSLK